MFKKLKDLYKAYRVYIQTDLAVYALLILMIVVYIIVSLIF
jgi:hypothetical protein